MSTKNNIDQIELDVVEGSDAAETSVSGSVIESNSAPVEDIDGAVVTDPGARDSKDMDGDAVAEDAEGSNPDEGDIAADYLEELLDIADIDGDIDIEERDGRTYISILTEDGTSRELENLVGRDGEVLEALQELTRLSALSGTSKRSRIILDIAGHRVDRSSKLRRIAEDAVEEVKNNGGSVSLKPMSAYERKVVHDAVADLGFHSESEGEGSSRHVVISVE